MMISSVSAKTGVVTMIEADSASLTADDYRIAVQNHIDVTAIARLYDSGTSCASYAASTNPIWAAEAAVFIAWRDEVWEMVYGLWASPPDPVPTPEALIASLPSVMGPVQSMANFQTNAHSKLSTPRA